MVKLKKNKYKQLEMAKQIKRAEEIIDSVRRKADCQSPKAPCPTHKEGFFGDDF